MKAEWRGNGLCLAFVQLLLAHKRNMYSYIYTKRDWIGFYVEIKIIFWDSASIADSNLTF